MLLARHVASRFALAPRFLVHGSSATIQRRFATDLSSPSSTAATDHEFGQYLNQAHTSAQATESTVDGESNEESQRIEYLEGEEYHRDRRERESQSRLEQWRISTHIKQTTGRYGTVHDPGYVPSTLLTNPPRPSQVTLELLMASQAHMGHATALWNPANSRYIFGIREGIHIISLDATAQYLRRAAKVVSGTAERGGLILFVGTRPGFERAVVRAAELAKPACHLFDNWIPGTLTNGDLILAKCVRKVVDDFDQEMPQFNDQVENITALKPDLVVILNPLENATLLHECKLFSIPTIGVIDTDADPTCVTYPIPANDDSIRCIQVIAGVLGRAGEEGQRQRLRNATESNTKTVSNEALKIPKRFELKAWTQLREQKREAMAKQLNLPSPALMRQRRKAEKEAAVKSKGTRDEFAVRLRAAREARERAEKAMQEGEEAQPGDLAAQELAMEADEPYPVETPAETPELDLRLQKQIAETEIISREHSRREREKKDFARAVRRQTAVLARIAAKLPKGMVPALMRGASHEQMADLRLKADVEFEKRDQDDFRYFMNYLRRAWAERVRMEREDPQGYKESLEKERAALKQQMNHDPEFKDLWTPIAPEDMYVEDWEPLRSEFEILAEEQEKEKDSIAKAVEKYLPHMTMEEFMARVDAAKPLAQSRPSAVLDDEQEEALEDEESGEEEDVEEEWEEDEEEEEEEEEEEPPRGGRRR